MTPPLPAYMFIFRNTGPDTHSGLTSEQKAAIAKKWDDWIDGLVSRGKVKHAAPLGLEGRVVAGAGGRRVIDGPYAEGKEVVGGYVFLDADDIDEATAIAQECPGLPFGLTVEVREVAAHSPVLNKVKARAIR